MVVLPPANEGRAVICISPMPCARGYVRTPSRLEATQPDGVSRVPPTQILMAELVRVERHALAKPGWAILETPSSTVGDTRVGIVRLPPWPDRLGHETTCPSNRWHTLCNVVHSHSRNSLSNTSRTRRFPVSGGERQGRQVHNDCHYYWALLPRQQHSWRRGGWVLQRRRPVAAVRPLQYSYAVLHSPYRPRTRIAIFAVVVVDSKLHHHGFDKRSWRRCGC